MNNHFAPNRGRSPKREHTGKVLSGTSSTAISIVTTLFCVIGCFWMLFSVLSYSKTEHITSIHERDLTSEYKTYSDEIKSLSLEGIYSVDPIYVIPDTQIIANKPSEQGFGSVGSREEFAAIVQQAESYGLIEAGQLKFPDENTPWHTSVNAEYYLDETILSVSWKALIDQNAINFTEVVIAHPSQFRKYLTENTFSSSKRKTVSALSKELNAVVGMSADFYAYRHKGVVVYGGELYRSSYMPEFDNCYINREGDLLFSPRGSITDKELPGYIEQNNINFSLSFGPILVEDGEVSPKAYGDYVVGQPRDYYARAAIGQIGKQHYLLCTIDGGATSLGAPRDGTKVHRLAEVMQNMGCDKAYTLDGGQTATMTVNSKVFNSVGYGSERPVSDIIFFATALPESHSTEDAQ
ncbi:MAG: phosphodiester glycosidase family protein [Ruminococcaceae bacterium]|nr:phosphodiester glycosidase family protein [Oscillospiraceae bacterium]